MAADSDVPEFYVDQFRATVGPYGIVLSLGISPPHPTHGQSQAKDLCRLRMSLEHAKIMVMIMKRQLKAYEDETAAPINIPRAIYNGLGLSAEDW
jgi:hypothetical protein